MHVSGIRNLSENITCMTAEYIQGISKHSSGAKSSPQTLKVWTFGSFRIQTIGNDVYLAPGHLSVNSQQYLISWSTFSAPYEFGNPNGTCTLFQGTKKVGCEIKYCQTVFGPSWPDRKYNWEPLRVCKAHTHEVSWYLIVSAFLPDIKKKDNYLFLA